MTDDHEQLSYVLQNFQQRDPELLELLDFTGLEVTPDPETGEKLCLSPSKVMGLGTDGAKVMTGTGKGLTGYMLRDNPMLVNYHCIAHRLALVTSQAANSIPYLVDYQRTLTGIFYFFKASANRVSKLHDIQTVLEEPNLKIKEVHEVRWLSTYIAVQTVYRTMDSLLTFFSVQIQMKSQSAMGRR